MTKKSFTLRLSEETYNAVKQRADKSVALFVREAIQARLNQIRDEEIREGLLSLVGEDEDYSALRRSQDKVIKGAC